MAELKTIYYPWALMRNQMTLKKALVYFDKVIVVCEERILTRLEADLPPAKEFQSFLEATAPLRKIGILELVSPETVMAPPDSREIIYASVVDDLKNPELRKIRPPFSVFGDDEFLVDIGDKGAMAMLNYFLIDFYAENYRSFKFKHGYSPTFGLNKAVEYELPDKIRAIYDPLIFGKSGLSVAQFIQAFAVAQVLLLSRQQQACLFTDDPAQDQYLRLKYQSSVKRALRNKGKRYLNPANNSAIRSGAIAHQILESLPNFFPEDFEEIIALREVASEEFSRFRLSIQKLASEVTAQPFEVQFEAEIRRVVVEEVNPSILDLRTKLRTSRDKTIQRLFKKLASKDAVIPFAIGMFARLPLPLTLAVSAATIGLDAAIETYFERREIRESNGLSFLLNFEK